MRQIKISEAAIGAILDKLDAEDARAEQTRRPRETRFSYRVQSLRADVTVGRDQVDSHIVAARNIGREGMSFLISQVLHVGAPCTIHLLNMQNNWQMVAATVARCRYIQGSVCVHEVDVHFGQPVDPASFAPSAIQARVLIADDSPMARRLLTHMLDPLNVETTCVGDGVSAVREALSNPFDLIIMDIEMPQLDGISAVKLLRKKGYIRPISAISCRTSPADREACLLAGCDEFLPKPPRRERIAAVIRRTRPQPLVSSLLHEPGMTELIDDFVRDLLRRSTQLEEAYHDRDLDKLGHLARELKGEAGGFGFESITGAAKDVEAAIEKGLRLTEMRPYLSRLVRLCLAARPATCDVDVRREFGPPAVAPVADEFIDADGAPAASSGDLLL